MEKACEATTKAAPLLHSWRTGPLSPLEFCGACLTTRQADGSSDAKPCRGRVRLALRADTLDEAP